MEGLRSEVSQKIKKAIQAKLLELGVTVDDALPDYIMVLVVNKKSKEQMENDLVLFLQGKTTAFVEWLAQILGRLQTMSMQAKGPPRVPPPHDVPATAAAGGRIINLREESTFPPAGRSSERARHGGRPRTAESGARGPRSAVRRSSAADDSDGEAEGRPVPAVASTVRVTDRPRPPAHLLPRPDILVRAMTDARRSTSGAPGPGQTGRRRRRRSGAGRPPAAGAGADKQAGSFAGDLRAKLRAVRQGDSARPAGGRRRRRR
ncbi:Zinc finger CCCH domain-containing protein 14 [Amphibalanus amphitrite]|uniref:Zinc finger CCCH domain-containing protein 14 n=1 Tax=Amphibalanus amphitrite TaxID=1232801 RepID=A0A6A4XAZ1_AMPAM|nr:Zinc finger CCCH domain-containing protein 14 [Amphibalanus amphitrite]